MKTSPKVKIVALACNEAYFLPQWVYHHLYFGFDWIDIIVNRCIDKTSDILETLKKHYGKISIINFDWWDKILRNYKAIGSFQYSAYMYAYMNTDPDFDYILFIDVDEFWIPSNCKDSIQTCIQNLDFPNVCVFQWFAFGGSNKYLMPMLSRRYFRGHLSSFGKSLIKTNLDPIQIQAHNPSFNYIDNIVLADRSPLIPNPECFEKLKTSQSTKLLPYFIMHDHMRTHVAYLAKMSQGRASSGACSSFETMATARAGYYSMGAHFEHIRFNNSLPQDYYRGFSTLVDNLNLKKFFDYALLDLYYVALNSLRLLSGHPECEAAQTVHTNIKPLPDLHKKLLKEMAEIDDSLNDLKDYLIPVEDTLLNGTQDEIYKRLFDLSRIYPYAVDEKLRPFFLNKLFSFLLSRKDFKSALDLINNENLLSITHFGKDWAYDSLVKSYIKNMKKNEAFELLNKMKYRKERFILDELEKLCRKDNLLNE